MDMNISKKKLGVIGLSIKVNRKKLLRKTNAGKWTQKNFCMDICSQNSMISIEKGNVSRYSDIYEVFANKLEMKLADDPNVDKKMTTYTKRLYEAVEYYDLAKVEKYVKKSLELLEPYKNCLWYKDYYMAVYALSEHYLHQNLISREDRDYYADMIGEFSDFWDDLLKSMIYCSAFHDLDTDEFEDRFNDFNIEESKSAFNKVNTFMYYYAKEYTRKMQELYKSLENEWIEQKNYIRLIDLYSTVLVYNSNFDVSEVDAIRIKIEGVLEIVNIPQYKLNEFYYNLGEVYYNLKEYDKSMNMMSKADTTKPAFVYIGHMQRMVGKDVSIPYYNDETLAIFPKNIQLLYEYFINVNKIPIKNSEKFLMTKVLPVLNAENEGIVNLVKEELEMLVEETKHYKNLMVFNKKIKKK